MQPESSPKSSRKFATFLLSYPETSREPAPIVAQQTNICTLFTHCPNRNHYNLLPYALRQHPCLYLCYLVIVFMRRKSVVYGPRAVKKPPAVAPADQGLRVSFDWFADTPRKER